MTQQNRTELQELTMMRDQAEAQAVFYNALTERTQEALDNYVSGEWKMKDRK